MPNVPRRGKSSGWSILFWSLLFIMIGGAAAFFFYPQGRELLFPCQKPIAYSIGSIDKRFGLSQAQAQKAIAQAESIWEGSVHRQLFVYDPSSSFTINFVYDYRQAAMIKLKSLGIGIQHDKDSYAALEETYRQLKAVYEQEKAAYEAAGVAYRERGAAYAAEVASWNKRGGAPKDVYERLHAEQDALSVQADDLEVQRKAMNITVDNLNAVVVGLNTLAGEVQGDVTKYNSVGASTGKEFEEGVYATNGLERSITIYSFSNTGELIRVLAHELGHALGLPHLESPSAIMYRLNRSKNDHATPEDLAALKQLCRMP